MGQWTDLHMLLQTCSHHAALRTAGEHSVLLVRGSACKCLLFEHPLSLHNVFGNAPQACLQAGCCVFPSVRSQRAYSRAPGLNSPGETFYDGCTSSRLEAGFRSGGRRVIGPHRRPINSLYPFPTKYSHSWRLRARRRLPQPARTLAPAPRRMPGGSACWPTAKSARQRRSAGG